MCSTVGGVQYRGEYHDACGGISSAQWGYHDACWEYLEYRGGVQTMGDIRSTVGDTQHRGGHHDARGGYHEYCGGVQYRGGKTLLSEYPYDTEHHHSTRDIPTRVS